MTLRKRYILIIIGVIIFFTATPLLIMGIQGYIYDFDQKKFVKTAILVIKTDPKGAEITLTGPSGSKHFKTNKTIRFLTPGDYEVKIEKEGYHTWQKRLSLKGALVTWANDGLGEVKLIPTSPKLLGQNSNYTPKTQTRSSPFTYRFEPSITGTGTVDLVSAPEGGGNSTILVTNIPQRNNTEIIPAPNRLLFLIMDRSLYQITDRLEYLAEGVDFAVWHDDINKLVYGNSHEISFYNPYDAGPGQRELINRTSETGDSWCVMTEIGYLLRAYGNVIRAIELDGRDHRNTYDILASDNTLEIMECDKNGKNIVVREGRNTFKTYSLK